MPHPPESVRCHLFNVDGAPVDHSQFGLAVGTTSRVSTGWATFAFVSSKAGRFSAGDETVGIRSLGGLFRIVGRVRSMRATNFGRGFRISPRPLREKHPMPNCACGLRRLGDAFLDRLAGDFCFVLWDGARKRLICARDQLGIRSLFHADVGGTWFVSDSLDWIAHTGGSSARSGRYVDRRFSDRRSFSRGRANGLSPYSAAAAGACADDLRNRRRDTAILAPRYRGSAPLSRPSPVCRVFPRSHVEVDRRPSARRQGRDRHERRSRLDRACMPVRCT